MVVSEVLVQLDFSSPGFTEGTPGLERLSGHVGFRLGSRLRGILTLGAWSVTLPWQSIG